MKNLNARQKAAIGLVIMLFGWWTPGNLAIIGGALSFIGGFTFSFNIVDAYTEWVKEFKETWNKIMEDEQV